MPERSCSPESLLIVRSTLEVAVMLKQIYPALAPQINDLEAEVKSAGQLLIDAGSVARGRLALERIRLAQVALENLRNQEFRLAA